MTPGDPHADAPLLLDPGGARLEDARAAVVLAHGRGDTAEGILGLAPLLRAPGVAFLAPEAAGRTWYPQSFLAPIPANEPYLTSALRVIGRALGAVSAAGIPPERTVLAGFSQGACLSLEYAARHARRYGAVLGFSGGLIGPDGTPRDHAGTLDGTPVFLGCSDVDPHIPRTRVEESAAVLERLGASVDARIYTGMGHTVNDDELEAARELVRRAAGL